MKKQKWVKKRHRVISNLARLPFKLFLKIKYSCDIHKDKSLRSPMLVLFNHQTCMDQCMVGLCFKDPLYFMASEDIFSNGFKGKLLKWALHPIPKSKSVKDLTAIRNCLQVVKEGGSIAIAPEGNRTYSGKINYYDIGIAKLAKSLKIDLVIVNIIGGFAVEPRWANKVRKGHIDVRINSVIKKDEIINMDVDKLFEIIQERLNVEQFEINQKSYSKKRAEYLERVLYICPNCGSISTLHSCKNEIECSNCKMKATYNENLQFEVNNGNLEFKDVNEWYKYQESFIINKNIDFFRLNPFFDENIKLFQTLLGDRKKAICRGTISINDQAIEIKNKKENHTFNLKDIIAVTCVGKHKLNFYLANDIIYQIKGDVRFNPVKYMHAYYRISHINGGNQNETYLGI